MTVTTPLGAVIRDAEGTRLEYVRSFPDPIERIWAAITNPDELATWFGTWRGDPSSGWVEVSSMEGDGTFKRTQVVECDRPNRVSVVLPTPYGPWPLSISLSESEGVTTAVFIHRLADGDDAGSLGAGWHYYLDRLASALTGDRMPEGEDWPSYEPLASSYGRPADPPSG
ncbi:MAG TPA: SRPBCC domain-containing protein [Candidatus Limnocylindrales bacterium]|nr:SRPBCC domain-containing protein [Candidatus Limnocylindrales bacterium]